MQSWEVCSGRHQTQKVLGGPWGPCGAVTDSPGSCLLLVHPCRIPPFSTGIRNVRQVSRYLLSNLLGFTLIFLHLPGKNTFKKLHLCNFFSFHDQRYFGREKSVVLQVLNLFLVVICSDFTPALYHLTTSYQHFGCCRTFSRVLVTARDRIPIWIELGSNTVWPFLHKWAEINWFHCSLALHHHIALQYAALLPNLFSHSFASAVEWCNIHQPVQKAALYFKRKWPHLF